jgi:hypothetical protein
MKVTTFAKTFESHNLLTVAVGTNCPQGGDGGHGGRTVLRLSEDGGPFIVKTDSGEKYAQFMEITMEGDTEGETFLDALKFAVMVLEKQRVANIAQLQLEEMVERQIAPDYDTGAEAFAFIKQ